ncbi:putative islet amyloid polypeptide [Triplophysa rosa]|uniref:Islet amyloid polypeptide n=1 Tax=Triplophysa rosa TaxID=992332 RepID=A0A9W7W8T6_TRIRA|nr:putative islet amyloid polypeptide [Triplophysa rosa]
MYHLKLPIQVVLVFVILHCVATVPHNRPLGFVDQLQLAMDREEPRGLSMAEPLTGLAAIPEDRPLQIGVLGVTTPFASTPAASPPASLGGKRGRRDHHIEKRKCNTATCVTQRLADFLVRSSNTIGTIYAPTNVGSSAYGKRDLLQAPIYVPF